MEKNVFVVLHNSFEILRHSSGRKRIVFYRYKKILSNIMNNTLDWKARVTIVILSNKSGCLTRIFLGLFRWVIYKVILLFHNKIQIGMGYFRNVLPTSPGLWLNFATKLVCIYNLVFSVLITFWIVSINKIMKLIEFMIRLSFITSLHIWQSGKATWRNKQQFRTVRKYCRADEIERRFINACIPFR